MVRPSGQTKWSNREHGVDGAVADDEPAGVEGDGGEVEDGAEHRLQGGQILVI